jgi:hypothetical protein
MDEPANLKYESIMKKEFVDHANKPGHIETTAEIVGVERQEDVYKKVRITMMKYFCNFS